MPSLTLDPYLLATPDIAAGRERIESYVQELLNWSVLRRERWASVCISERGVECLNDDGCFPLYRSIRAAFERYGIDHLDVQTVIAVVYFLLQQTPSLEVRFGVQDVLVDPLVVKPDIPRSRSLPRVGRELARCLAIIGFVARHAPSAVTNHCLATRESSCAERLLMVSGTVLHAEMLSHCAFVVVEYPVGFAEGIRVCETFREFLLSLDSGEVWRSAETVEQAKLALRLSVFDHVNTLGIQMGWEHTEGFSIGREFLGSLVSYGFKHDPPKANRLLRACAETVLGENLRAVHALREGPGGNAPQRRRGDDKAQRRDIDDEFHLHYWDRPKGGPEFGCVGPHNSFDIPF